MRGSGSFGVSEWIIRSLCCGCFGIVTMPNFTPPQEHHACKLAANEKPHDDDDDDDESDGMFQGLFYLGSKVLTEVEMQSPVEESKILATPIRTPRRSNTSSRASSTRELDFGASQVCLVDSEFCSSSDAIVLVPSCEYPTPSVSPSCVNTSFPCCTNASSVRMCLSSSHEQMDHILTVSSSKDNSAKQDSKSVALYKHTGRLFKPDNDTTGIPSRRVSNRNLDEENLQPSLESSQEGEQFSQSGTVWNNRKCQARVGSSSPECRTGNPLLGQLKNACAFRYRAAGKFTVVSEGLQTEIPVGSLPDGNKTNIASRGWQKDNDGGRRARSLTDEDFNELRGCIDLGFVCTEDHIPDLCETLPALEVCYAIAHGPMSPVCNLEDSKSVSPGSSPISPWRVASPGDQPQQVKTRLRHWAQAVACNLRQAR